MAPNPITDMLSSLAKKAFGDNATPGPGDVGPTTDTKGDPAALVTLEMTEEEAGQWWKEIGNAEERIKQRETGWDTLLKAYLPNVVAYETPENIKVNTHFRNVHSKIGQLFYRSPDLVLTPKEPSPAQNTMPNPMAQMAPPGAPPPPPLTMEDIVSIKQAVLNTKLGRDGLNAGRLIDELLFDVLAWAGIGCAKLGYRCFMKKVQQPMMGPPPPQSQPGAILGLSAQGPPPGQMVPQLGPDGQPQMEDVSLPVFDDYYLRRFSPKKLLINSDLHSTRFDEDATFMGMVFFMSPKAAARAFQLNEEDLAKLSEDTSLYKYDEDASRSGSQGLVKGYELFVKASVYTDEVHPQAINQLVFLEGMRDKPVVWRPSPDQTFDEKGKLTDDSLIGFPIRVLTIRDLADSPFPPSDSAFTNSGIKQLSTFRKQSVQLRDAAIGKYLVDVGAFEEGNLDELKNGPLGSYISVQDGALKQGANAVVVPTAQLHQAPDNPQTEAAIKQENDETLGISSVQSGTPEATVRTATEIATVQSAVAARNDKELNRVVGFYLDCARMIDQLLMRYADQEEYVHIVGQDGAQKLQVWNNQIISGKYLYDIAPDSQVRIDNATDFTQLLNYYNVAARDPLFNRKYVMRKLARMRGLDPTKAIMENPPPPPTKPELPSISFAFKGEDLFNPLVLDILEKTGMIPPQQQPGAAAPGAPPQQLGPHLVHPQPEHGGPADHVQPISQHMASNSGNRPNEPGSPNFRAGQVK